MCEVCGETMGNESAFRTETRTYKSVCGGCKFKLTFTPEFKAKFESEMGALCTLVMGEKVKVEVSPHPMDAAPETAK